MSTTSASGPCHTKIAETCIKRPLAPYAAYTPNVQPEERVDERALELRLAVEGGAVLRV